jgi:hypothetical protein
MKKLERVFWVLSGLGLLGIQLLGVENSHASLAFLPLLIGGLASLGSGIAGALSQASAADRAAMLQEKGMKEWFDINIPDPNQRRLALDRFVQAGELHPSLEESVKAEGSEFNKVTQDPALRNSRLRALSALEEQGYGGEQVQDAAARNKAIIESGAANRGRQQAIVGDLDRRGQLGSGLELSARLDAAQAEGDRLASQGLDLEAQRRQRMLAAMEGAGNLAGDIQGQDYQMQADRAKANDAINLFNTQNMIGLNQRNVDRTNDANQYNLGVKQDVANRNTGVANYEQEFNKNLLQQDFENRAKKAAGVSGQYGQMANQANQQGQNAANMWGGIASGVGTLAQGFMGQQNKKEDRDLLSSLFDQQKKNEFVGPWAPSYYS